MRGTAAPDCWKTRAVGTNSGAGALSHIINERERSKELLPCFFLLIPGQDVGKHSIGNLPLDQLELEAQGDLFHE